MELNTKTQRCDGLRTKWKYFVSLCLCVSVPFGGVGMSGTGNYHGFYGFKTFSHERNVMRQGAFDPLAFLYPPYHKEGDKGLRAKIQQIAKKILG